MHRQSFIRPPGTSTPSSTPTIPRCWTGSYASSVSASPAVSAPNKPPPKRVAASARSSTRPPQPFSIPKTPGAPVIHDKGPEARIHDPQRNIVGEVHGDVGNVEQGFAAADAIYEGTYVTQRVQHAHLETHCAIGWLDEAGRLNIRSSTQTPFLTRRALTDLFELDPEKVRVVCERIGGGFGGKQEMLVEDVVALAVLKTGRPVKLEFTREEQFIGATTRHPMRVRIKAGARRDGR